MSDNPIRNKALVIGLDGADFTLMNEFKADLPNLNKLIERGVFSKLKSTIPNASTVAWTSFMTGKNPAKHGVLDFVTNDKEDPTNVGSPVNARTVDSLTLWKLLSRERKNVIVFGVPVTYPPEEVNGLLIGGFPIPSDADDYTYPRALAKELKEKGWNFADVPTASYSKERLPEFLDELYRRIKEKTEATLYLMEKYDWDLFVVHYFETDKVQHEFLNYKYKDIVGEKLFGQYGDAVKKFFIEMDNQIGRLLATIDKNTSIFIVSDHGFGPNENLIFLDSWLLKNGYIQLRAGPVTKFKYLLFRLGLTPLNLYRLAPAGLKFALLEEQDKKYYSDSSKAASSRGFAKRMLNLSDTLFLNKKTDIDWGQTEAYCFGSTGLANVFFSSKSTIDQSLKAECRKKIEAITVSSGKLFDQVYAKEDIYNGKHADQLPDIIAFDSSFRCLTYNHPAIFLSNSLLTENYVTRNRATHNMNGIFIASGPGIKQNAGSAEANIIDICPTILHLFLLSLPEDMDGRVLKEIFMDDSIQAKTEIKYEKAEGKKLEDYNPSQEDKQEMMKRLKAMGYLA